MKGCERCRYNNNKFECIECAKKRRENSYEMIDAYTYVTNTFECFNNTDPDQKSFYGCLKASYNDQTGEYECLTCRKYDNNFIMVVNDKICINEWVLSYCEEAENLGSKNSPKYSCRKCLDYSAKINSQDNIIKCSGRYENLIYCLEGVEEKKIEEDGYEYYSNRCTQCVSNANFNSSNICVCDSDSFGKYNEWCYKCDDRSYGNPGCIAEKGCNYYSYSFDQLNCNECKNGYFKYSEGQCYSCSSEIRNCEKCHYDSSSAKLICDECPNGYSYNEEEKKCELKNCEDYPEISEGCVICEGKVEEFLSKNQCQTCKPGYLKTKDNKCVYGGPECYKCSYAITENGDETNVCGIA